MTFLAKQSVNVHSWRIVLKNTAAEAEGDR